MPSTHEGYRLLAVHAHPDDESSKGAATTAKYVDAGARVLIVTCTGGERGDILNEKLRDDPHIQRDIAQVRRDEMKAAIAALGCEHVWLGFVDSGLPEGDPLPPLPDGCFALEPIDVPTEALVRVIREFRPHVVTTYDEKGSYPHPDHIMTHTVSMAAFEAAGRATAYPHAGAVWQPLKLYYGHGHTQDQRQAFHDALLAEGMESPYTPWVTGARKGMRRKITTKVPTADYFAARDEALMAHTTQVDPDGYWFHMPRDLEATVWPIEEFEAALSYVPIEPGESDLFAGLGSPSQADSLAEKGGLALAYDGRVAS